MVKVARVVSVEFNSPAEKRKTLKEYRARLAEFAPGIELLIAVNTSDTEVLAIQVYPDSDTLERAKELNEQFQETIGRRPFGIELAMRAMSIFGFKRSNTLARTRSREEARMIYSGARPTIRVAGPDADNPSAHGMTAP